MVHVCSKFDRRSLEVLLALLLGVTACARQSDESGQAATQSKGTTSIRQALNANPKLNDFVVLANNSVTLRTASSVSSQVQVTGGDVGARGTSGPFLSGGVAIDV